MEVGQKYNRLTVLKMISPINVECKCDCGNVKVFNKYSLTRKYKASQSCGCLMLETNKKQFITHGHQIDGKKTKEYNSWDGMKQRCLNPNTKFYDYYGGRGITICERWLKFENFLEDMGKRPIGMTLDRKDPDGNYEPNNVRWATYKQQAQNKRNVGHNIK